MANLRKDLLGASVGVCITILLAACSVNPATGDRQFTALMPAGQEERIGASEHDKVTGQFGGPFQDKSLEAYVNRIGARVAMNTERSDVQYKFFVLDTPVVNAFAMPGGYIYVSRGLLALANNEAELAAVLAHEIGHITARHSAERYSQGVLAGLGMAVLSAAVDDPGIARAAGIGSELALKSYSRGQEYQADELGVRYLSRAGYDPFAAASFLNALDRWSKYEAQVEGKNAGGTGYFATHPQTDDRVMRASNIAKMYPPSNVDGGAEYLRRITGLTYGESARTGFLRGQRFIHPDLGLTFTFPNGFTVQNQADKVIGVSKATGAAVIFDGVRNSAGRDAVTYLKSWAGNKPLENLEEIDVNGAKGATGEAVGSVNGQNAAIRLVAVSWRDGRIYRFQMAMPNKTPALEKQLINMIHSFRSLSAEDRNETRALRLEIVTAKEQDTVETLATYMNLSDIKDRPAARFRVLNGMTPNEKIEAGRAYKVVR